MPYVAIPNQLKNIESIHLELMSPEEMQKMSYGEVLTGETINYRTGAPQMNGLFCQAIFGPVKDWECACGKYKRYRYAGVICDKCGVEVTHSSVRRERMGHITLAAPCVHPWFLRIIPSRISLVLEIKSADISRITYFSAYVITEINEDLRQEYISKIDREAQSRIKVTKGDYDKKFEELSRQYQSDKARETMPVEELKTQYETNKDILKTQQAETIARIKTIAEVAKKEISSLQYKDVITEVQYQELAQKFGPVFKAEIGAEAVENLLKQVDLKKEIEALREKIINTKGQNKKKMSQRLRLLKQFISTNTRPEWMVLKRIMVLPPELRPMLQLDGGRFAASDLNELYRRLINRNNRLRKLIQIGAPEVILRNEKRMLQEAVEALIDNSAKGGRQVMASTGIKRPLKSLTDILKGKQGRFRQNLLGKRVDYSGRSVIIIGPNLDLDQCGIPKEMALELFKPFMIGKIIQKSEKNLMSEEDQAFNVHSARRLIETKKPIVYDILDEVIKDKHVLLNRAPTLHRLSFLAFKPILIEGKAIQLHPLVCRGFNADFDGDQMAVHLPITVKGQEEAKNLMVASRNLLKPASGELITAGHQDIVLGAYYLTIVTKKPKELKHFSSMDEAVISLENKNIELGELIKVKIQEEGSEEKIIETTAGRIIFNQCFPKGHKFFNQDIDKKTYESILNESYHELEGEILPKTLDTIKNLAFEYVTRSGITLSVEDLISPKGKEKTLEEANRKVILIQELYELGMMTDPERYKQVVSVWRDASDEISKFTKEQMEKHGNVGLMISSGSRGNISQLNQMVGIRGLSVTASGETIELPAQHGYKEGLTGLEYFISMKGQRKALADIALKTADAGYLTRRLVDVSQNVIITNNGDVNDYDAEKEGTLITKENSKRINKSVAERVYGRFLLKDIVSKDGKVLAKKGQLVDLKTRKVLEKEEVNEAWIPSIVKSRTPRGISQIDYGSDFSTHKPVTLGTAVGIIAAQSLGEPSTQLTMRSKHTGGILAKSDITTGLPRVEEIFEARTPKIKAPISPINGVVEKIEGSIDNGFTVTVVCKDSVYRLPFDPSKDKLLLKNGDNVSNSDTVILDSSGQIITAGLSGEIESNDKEVIIKQLTPEVLEFTTEPGMALLVRKGNRVTRGQAISEGPLDLQNLLDIGGIDVLQQYIIEELNEIYLSNGITVNEKHIEVIIRQMCNKVQIIDAGDSDLTPGENISRALAVKLAKQLVDKGARPVTFKRIITGISRASLSTESFLSAASFQETARVLVEAVVSGRKDNLIGLKENVILGQLIPAGTGFNKDKVSLADVQEEFDEEAQMLESE